MVGESRRASGGWVMSHSLGEICPFVQPENFLLSNKTDDATLKMADFGLSTWFKPGQKFTHIVGSAYYVAPEVKL